MSDVDDLVTWLRQQLDEDERAAREAGYRALAWSANGTWYLEGVEHNVVGQEEAFCHPHNVDHIARHDPARVLAEVDAKRAIIDWCADVLSPDPEYQVVVAEGVLRRLALPYADRPGYRAEWKPVTSASA